MDYKASEIVRRAKNMADISNTDYISYEEDEQYLQDAWKSLYQEMINKGDKQFIKEVGLGSGSSYSTYTEYELPFDLYQICSINDRMSGREILRHSNTESINSGTYDVINNKLRLYGYSGNNLVLTYWLRPFYLSFPNRPVEVEEDLGGMISTAGNTVLFDDGTVYNLITKETIASITLPEEEDYDATYFLGNGHIVALFEDSDNMFFKVINFKGTELWASGLYTKDSRTVFYDKHYNLYIAVKLPGEDTMHIVNFLGDDIGDFQNVPLMFIDEERILAAKIVDGKYYWVIETEDVVLFEVEMTEKESTAFDHYLPYPTNDFDGMKAFFFNGNMYLISPDNHMFIEELLLPTAKRLRPIKYGIIGTNGNDYTVYSGIPDTDLNFPNELFFSCLAADLALRYAMKQNADTGALDNLYQSYHNQFMDSLSQAGSYTRIKNVYR